MGGGCSSQRVITHFRHDAIMVSPMYDESYNINAGRIIELFQNFTSFTKEERLGMERECHSLIDQIESEKEEVYAYMRARDKKYVDPLLCGPYDEADQPVERSNWKEALLFTKEYSPLTDDVGTTLVVIQFYICVVYIESFYENVCKDGQLFALNDVTSKLHLFNRDYLVKELSVLADYEK